MKEVTDKIKCLYYIKDIRTDKIIYIGQTSDFQTRIYCHFGHKNQPIDLYMFNEGRDNFVMKKFNIDIENYTEEDIRKKEQELILQYDTINNGLNKNRSGFLTYDKNYHKQYYTKEYRKNYMKKYRDKHKF